VYASTRAQVILSSDGLPQKTVWLLIHRTLRDDPHTYVHAGPFFPLARENQDREKAPSITLSQLKVLTALALSMKRHTFESLLEQIIWIQTRHHRVCLSHRRKRVGKF
jgi:hypothetical protein